MAISNGFSLGKLIKQTTTEEGGFAGISIEGASGGGASVTTADTPPANPSAGDLWFNSSTLKTYVYYNDGTTSQWVVTNAVGTPGPQGPAGADGTNGADLLASTYSTPDDLPTSNNTVGDQAFVTSTNRLYIWTGAGWYNIALVNTTPTWDSGGLPEAAYELDSIGGSATSIVLSATDPEGLPLTWTYSITDSGNDLATITNDSNGTFTITAKSLADILSAGYDSDGGVFDITFKASDGVNLATALSEFTLSFALPYMYGTKAAASSDDLHSYFPCQSTSQTSSQAGTSTTALCNLNGISSSSSGFSGNAWDAGTDYTSYILPTNMPSGTAINITIAFAFKITDSTIHSGADGAGIFWPNINTSSQVMIGYDGGGLRLGGTGWVSDGTSVSALQTDTWYFYTMTGSGSSCKHYLNGQLEVTETASYSFGTTWSLMNYSQTTGGNTNNHYARGLIDELAVWERELSENDVLKLYQAYSDDYSLVSAVGVQ
jgi:hypothetical protein